MIDQLEALAGVSGNDGGDGDGGGGGARQDRTLSALLSELDQLLGTTGGGSSSSGSGGGGGAGVGGGNNQVLIVSTTSTLNAIDPSVLRPGRLDQHFAVPMPALAARRAILTLKLKGMPAAAALVGTDVVEEIAAASDGLSGAHLENVCREAALAALRADINCTALPAGCLRDALATLYRRAIP
jgi:SpoVK/Ycf46/Vps4 family AAA+-type ATPase